MWEGVSVCVWGGGGTCEGVCVCGGGVGICEGVCVEEEGCMCGCTCAGGRCKQRRPQSEHTIAGNKRKAQSPANTQTSSDDNSMANSPTPASQSPAYRGQADCH